MKYLLVFVGGVAVGAWALRANDSSCCQRVAYGARDKLADALGPFGGIASAVSDATGLTKLFPGALDFFGVPKDA